MLHVIIIRLKTIIDFSIMMKKILIALMLLLPTVLQAEIWREHPQFMASGIKNCIDAGDYVYMLVNNNINRFDKATNEIQLIKSSKGLSEDIQVQQIYYNYDKDYLVVAYLNSNMDVVMSDGSVRNVSALSDMVYAGSKSINDVTFGPSSIYVTTGFGYLEIDDTTLEMKRYRNYGKSLHSMVPVNGGLALAMGDSLYFSHTTTPESLSDFEVVSPLGNRAKTVTKAVLYKINDNRFFLNTTADSTYMKRVEIQTIGDSLAVGNYQYVRFTTAQPVYNIQKSPTGFLWNVLTTNSYYYTTDTAGNNYKRVTGKGAGIYSCYPAGDGIPWALGANGLFKNNAASTYYTVNAIGLDIPYYATYQPATGKLYLISPGPNAVLPKAGSTAKLSVYTYDGEQWSGNGCVWAPTSPTPKKNSSGGYFPQFDPRHPDTYYVGTWYSGLVKVVNDTVAVVFDERNSSVKGAANSYYRCIKAFGFDSQGNLWFVQNDDNNTAITNPVSVLTVDKLDNESFTEEDFLTYNIPGTRGVGSKFNTFAIGKDDVKVFSIGGYNLPIVIWRGDIHGTQESKSFSQIKDQRNNQLTFAPNGVNPFITSDSTGMVWVAASCFFYFDPTTGFGDELRVIRPVNSSGDFMLSGVGIRHIGVDYLNRKWVSTSTEGVYLLSPDGSEILKHFDTDNSIMPSNLVYSTCTMGNTGRVMIITSSGVVEYIENGEEQAALGELEAYPNPVLPDFTGLVAINGVAQGCQVKICNMQGAVVKEFTHDSNVATWDCCDADGERVETGVYPVYISAADGTYPDAPQIYLRVVK